MEMPIVDPIPISCFVYTFLKLYDLEMPNQPSFLFGLQMVKFSQKCMIQFHPDWNSAEPLTLEQIVMNEEKTKIISSRRSVLMNGYCQLHTKQILECPCDF